MNCVLRHAHGAMGLPVIPGNPLLDLSGALSMQPPVVKRMKAERVALDDPRPSLEERSGAHENYVAKVRTTAASLVKDRFLLQEDAARPIREAEASGVLR